MLKEERNEKRALAEVDGLRKLTAALGKAGVSHRVDKSTGLWSDKVVIIPAEGNSAARMVIEFARVDGPFVDPSIVVDGFSTKPGERRRRRFRDFDKAAEWAVSTLEKAQEETRIADALNAKIGEIQKALALDGVFAASRKRLDEISVPENWIPRLAARNSDSEWARLEIAFEDKEAKRSFRVFSIPFPFFENGIRRPAVEAPVKISTDPMDAILLSVLACEFLEFIQDADATFRDPV